MSGLRTEGSDGKKFVRGTAVFVDKEAGISTKVWGRLRRHEAVSLCQGVRREGMDWRGSKVKKGQDDGN